MSQEVKVAGRQSIYEQEQRPNKQSIKKVYNLSKDIYKVVCSTSKEEQGVTKSGYAVCHFRWLREKQLE